MSAVTNALKIYANGVVKAAKSYADKNDGYYDDWTSSSIANMLDTYVTVLQNSQANQVLGSFNYQPYINKILDMYPPTEIGMANNVYGEFSGTSKLYELTNSTLGAGDTFGFYAANINKFELLNANKKVVLSSKLTADYETVGFSVPAKYSEGTTYLKVYGTKGDSYYLYAYEIDDPANVTVEVGTPVSGTLQYTDDEDAYLLSDVAGFEPLSSTGAGEWRVAITSTSLDQLSASIARSAGSKAETFATESNALVADIARSGSGTIAKDFKLEVGTKKGVSIGDTDISYSVSFLSDDYSATKQTTASIDLKTATSGVLTGKLSWVGDIDWVKLVVGTITNTTTGDAYIITGMPTTSDFMLYDASGKKGSEVVDSTLTFTKSGTYYLQVSDDAVSAGTDYTLNIGLTGISTDSTSG